MQLPRSFCIQFIAAEQRQPLLSGALIRLCKTAFFWLVVLASSIGTGIGFSTSAHATDRAFAPRFTLSAAGDILIAANMNIHCSQAPAAAGSGANCTNAQTLGTLDRTNNLHSMVNVDIDSDPTTFNSSSARLNLPAGATVAFAGLYWGGQSLAASRNTVKLATPLSGGAYTTITASQVDDSAVAAATQAASYQAFANVTSSITGAGTYTVANVTTTVATGNAVTNSYAGWSLVVVYRLASEPARNMVVYDGYKRVAGAANVDISLSGFTTPPTGTVTSKLGVVAYDGDKGSTEGLAGLQFGPSVATLSPVFNTLNPQTDVFNSTISTLNANNADRNPNYINTLGFDADVFSPNTPLPNGASTAVVRVSSSNETIDLGVVTLATLVFTPVIKDELVKTVVDVNGGLLLPGDVLEYTIKFGNSGNDAATRVLLTDNIPAFTTYLPGSIVLSSTSTGMPAGARTDAADADSAEFDGPGNRIVVRAGRTPTAALGGQLNPGDNVTVRFRATVNPLTPGDTVINNTASVAFRGATLGTDFSDVSDSNTALPGDQPTAIVVASPDLVVTKTHTPASFVQASLLPATPTFSIVVTNSSSVPTFGTVSFTDALPPGFTAVALSGTGWTCTLASASCLRTDVLAANASYPPVTLAVTAANSGTFTNSVTVACNCEGASKSGNNLGTDTVSVTPSAVLSITKTNGVTALVAGQTISYTVTVANAGPSAADGATLADPEVPGLVCTSVTCASATATCPAAPIAISALQAGLALPSLPANSSLTFTLSCGVTATGL